MKTVDRVAFADLGLNESLLKAVSAEGYTHPTPIQAHSIPPILTGRDLQGCAQTGTGKTAAFALPILHRLTSNRPGPGAGRAIRCLVLSPTRELALQIGDSFRTYGRHLPLRSTVIFGGVSQLPQTKALHHGVDLLVATPGRLCDLIDQGYVKLSQVNTFVLDEADRMLDMGFLPDLKRIIAQLPDQRQTLLFSATMPTAIQKLAESILTDPVKISLAPQKATTELIDQSVCFVNQSLKSRTLIGLLQSRECDRVIVFTRTKHGADRIARVLMQAGLHADAIHGNKSQAARQRALAQFKARRIRVLVATDVAARGIDVDGISHVVNYDLPEEAETYVHRIGRTGRAGANGVAIAFCNDDERRTLKAIERQIGKPLTIEKIAPAPATAIASVSVDKLTAAEEEMDTDSRSRRPEHGRREGYSSRPGQRTDRPSGQHRRPAGGGRFASSSQSGEGRPGGYRAGGQRPTGHRPGGYRSADVRPQDELGASQSEHASSGHGDEAGAGEGTSHTAGSRPAGRRPYPAAGRRPQRSTSRPGEAGAGSSASGTGGSQERAARPAGEGAQRTVRKKRFRGRFASSRG